MSFKVKATARGYYGDLREDGVEFEIAKLEDYSTRWMEPVGWKPDEELEKAQKAEPQKPEAKRA